MADESAFLFWTDKKGAVRRTKIGLRPVTIGSGSMCVLALGDPEAATVHAVVEREQDRTVMRKLSRTHPLQVNGRTVEEVALRHGDTIEVGTSRITYLEPVPLAPATLRLSLKREDQPGAVEVEIAHAITVIGRAEGDLLIEDSSVSRVHLEIENFGPEWCWVRDLDSTNGSELNGTPLVWRRPLRPGDILKAGRVLMRVFEGSPPPEHMAEAPVQVVTFVPTRAIG